MTLDDRQKVNAALNNAEQILGALNLPADNWIMQELAEAQRLGSALKENGSDDIKKIFSLEIDKQDGNRFRQSWIYRDLAFALQRRNFTAAADKANREARAIFKKEIYWNNTHHFLIRQISKIVPD